ncbi:hypothetical protein [uncultured Campylobacter sp.]|uniref:hypothetical protein n=1 Tax=uncultured Campylobacter sp. TaxID=218934 RepID=UPI002601EE8A|nr:hypothetical protein [uncultured Campylobacter sp.]
MVCAATIFFLSYVAIELKFSLARSIIYFGDWLPPCASKRYKIYRTSHLRPFGVNFIALAVASMK